MSTTAKVIVGIVIAVAVLALLYLMLWSPQLGPTTPTG